MSLVRIFINPDGSVQVMRPNMRYWNAEECSRDEFCKAVMDCDMANNSSLAVLPYRDVDEASVPTDRSRRHAWRWADNPGVYVDETVPDPPDPKKERIDRIEKAKTVEEIKAILKELVQ